MKLPGRKIVRPFGSHAPVPRTPIWGRRPRPLRSAIEAVRVRRRNRPLVLKPPSLSESFELLAHRAKVESMTLGQILDSLSGRSHALLIVFLSFPCATPLSIPGTGGPFGVALAFISLFLLLGKEPWIPGFVRRRALQQDRLIRVLGWMVRFTRRMEKLSHPRIPSISANRPAYWMNVFAIFVFSVVLALPVVVPVPFSNQVVALPILLIGLGLLEKDGLFIAFGYLCGLIAVGYYAGLFLLGDAIFTHWDAIERWFTGWWTG